MNILKFEKYNIKSKDKQYQTKMSLGIKKNEKRLIFFSKFELTSILNLYSKQVSKGFWKDYALDSQTDNAIFSVYKNSLDKPIYQIVKNSQKGHINYTNFLIIKDKEIINRSNNLFIILSKFEKKLNITKLKNYKLN